MKCEDCQNFKKKNHPLDDIIDGIIYQVVGIEKQEKARKMLNKLRYESIRHGAHIPSQFGTYLADEGLILQNHEDWIVK